MDSGQFYNISIQSKGLAKSKGNQLQRKYQNTRRKVKTVGNT